MSINEDNVQNFTIPEFSMSELITINDFRNKIKDVKIPLNGTGITPRVFNSWKNLDLIPINDPERRWNKFNFIEFLWLKMIKELREFGLSIDKIQKVKKILFDYDAMDLAIQYIEREGNWEVILKQIDGALAQFPPEAKKAIKEHITSNPKALGSILKEQEINLPLLDLMILNSIVNRKDNGIIIYSNGECIPWFGQYYEIDKDSEIVFKKPHIYISFSSFLFDFLIDEKMDAFVFPLQILSSEEHEILSYLRANELKEVKIKFSERSNKPFILEIVSGKQVTKEQAQQLMRNIVLKNYENITFKTNNNKTVYIERVQKRMLGNIKINPK